MQFDEMTLTQINKYLEMTRTKGATVLSLLGKIASDLEAIFNTDVGKKLLQDDLIRVEYLMQKSWDDQLTVEERAEFNYLRKIRLHKIIEELRKYLQATQMIKKTVSEVG